MKEYQVYVMCGITHSAVPIFAWRVRQKGLPPECRALDDECGGIALKYPHKYFVLREMRGELAPGYKPVKDKFGEETLEEGEFKCIVEVPLEYAVRRMMAKIKPQIPPEDPIEFIVGPAPGDEWADDETVKKIDEKSESICFKTYASEEEQKKIAELIEKYK